MTDVEQTRLPGVGVRHEFVTKAGERIGVIAHRSGHRDLLVYAPDDPDTCSQSLRLQEDDSRTLVELLGGSQVSEDLSEEVRQSVEGLTLEWVPVRDWSACTDCTMAEVELRERTGASIVAVVRRGEQDPVLSPGPDTKLHSGDVAVLVGTPEGIQAGYALLQGT
jgi:TrkA domain protein